MALNPKRIFSDVWESLETFLSNSYSAASLSSFSLTGNGRAWWAEVTNQICYWQGHHPPRTVVWSLLWKGSSWLVFLDMIIALFDWLWEQFFILCKHSPCVCMEYFIFWGWGSFWIRSKGLHVHIGRQAGDKGEEDRGMIGSSPARSCRKGRLQRLGGRQRRRIYIIHKTVPMIKIGIKNRWQEYIFKYLHAMLRRKYALTFNYFTSNR